MTSDWLLCFCSFRTLVNVSILLYSLFQELLFLLILCILLDFWGSVDFYACNALDKTFVCCGKPSFCPSVCLSQPSIVLKQLNEVVKCYQHVVEADCYTHMFCSHLWIIASLLPSSPTQQLNIQTNAKYFLLLSARRFCWLSGLHMFYF